MSTARCSQCGAQLEGDTTCADRLYRMLTSGGVAYSRLSDALARFALSHPKTYSMEALELAFSVLSDQRKRGADAFADADVADEHSALVHTRNRQWWRCWTRRARCH